MAEITKFNLYLSENQTRKLNLLSQTSGKSPEEIANEAVYSYLAIAEPFAEDNEPSEDQHEIMFCIPDAIANKMMNTLKLEDYDDLDEYIKTQVIAYFSPR